MSEVPELGSLFQCSGFRLKFAVCLDVGLRVVGLRIDLKAPGEGLALRLEGFVVQRVLPAESATRRSGARALLQYKYGVVT